MTRDPSQLNLAAQPWLASIFLVCLLCDQALPQSSGILGNTAPSNARQALTLAGAAAVNIANPYSSSLFPSMGGFFGGEDRFLLASSLRELQFAQASIDAWMRDQAAKGVDAARALANQALEAVTKTAGNIFGSPEPISLTAPTQEGLKSIPRPPRSQAKADESGANPNQAVQPTQVDSLGQVTGGAAQTFQKTASSVGASLRWVIGMIAGGGGHTLFDVAQPKPDTPVAPR